MSAVPAAAAAPAAPRLSSHPWIGILAVLLGAFISTLTGRLSSFGLADIRGAVHAGFDEGAWITTAQATAQMLVGPPAVWLGAVYGPRRVLTIGCIVFAAAVFLLPFSPDLPTLLLLQFVSGLGSGCFIPLTLGFVVLNLPPRLWAYGIAAYALNIELSLNVSASLEGYFVEHASWKWIFWQNLPLAAAMIVCVRLGMPRPAVNRVLLRHADIFGLVSVGLGLALVYAALDQGNRLDWFNSGLVNGLFAGGTALLVAFVIHERRTPYPWIDLRYAVWSVVPILLLIVSEIRLVILSTAFLIPQYLTNVLGYRAMQVGGTLIWIAVPQLVVAPFVGAILRRMDSRISAAIGLSLVGLACWTVGDGLTIRWGSAEFLPSQFLQSMGQTLALSSVVFLGILNLRPADALTFGAMLQTARLMGGELGSAALATFVRKSEQFSSNILTSDVPAGAPATNLALQSYAGAVAARSAGTVEAAQRSAALLGGAVRTQANILAYSHGFLVLALSTVGALLLLALVPVSADHPARHVPWFRRAKATT
jgi:DHA2 family multidrug resistance protein